VELRAAGEWPIQGDKRTLGQALTEIAPGLTILQDPGSRAFLVVTLKGEEERAQKAFAVRRRERLLRRLPRSVILSFCADLGDQRVYLRKTPPHRYSTDANPVEEWWPVDPEFRSPGLFVDFDRSIGDGNADEFMQRIEAWAKRHGVDLDALAAAEAKVPTRPRTTPDLPVLTGANALERLCYAQSPELIGRLVVPMDIALLLSRSA